jgi:Uma2 family endonuclease
MSTQFAARRWTYAEFAKLPDDGNRYEVIGGELYVTPAPGLSHQEIQTRLSYELFGFVRAHGLGKVYNGPVDVLFGEGEYLTPDLVFVRRGRESILRERGVEGAPDLIVEVLSPSTASRDRKQKRETYARFGVAQYWIVDPGKRRIEVYRPTTDATANVEIASEALSWTPVEGGPTLTLDVAELFEPAA